MEKQCYFIKLTPLKSFFFGGENTFGDQNRNYYVKSNYFPQQTAILGLIRYELLHQNNLLPLRNHQIEAKELIGDKSFIDDLNQNFGIINKISPVFICKDSLLYRFREVDYDCDFEQNSGGKFYFNGMIKDYIPWMNNFNPKENPAMYLIAKDEKDPLALSEIFEEDERIGIRKTVEKSDDNDDENNAFYKQVFLTLHKPYSFAFYLELDDNQVKFSGRIVQLGGEQSIFLMDVEKISAFPDFQTCFTVNPKKYHRLICLSDAYIPENIYESILFGWTETIPFRHLISDTGKDSENYYQGPLNPKNHKSGLFNLIKRGSVFFLKDENIPDFFRNPAFEKIGYNIYQFVKKQ